MIRKDKPQEFFLLFSPHFHYSSDVPTSKFGISIRRMEFFIGFLKFLPWDVESYVYISMNYLECCVKGELIFQRGRKGFSNLKWWFIDRREICLPLSAFPSVLKFDVLWQGYTSFDDTRFSIPRFTILATPLPFVKRVLWI